MTHHHADCVSSAIREVEGACKARGLRFTEIRRLVLKIIWQGHKAVTAAEIMRKLKNDKPPITYRALEFLEENGFIHKVASLNAYVGCPHPEKAHASQLLICGNCREVVEVHSPFVDTQVEAEAKKHHCAVTHRHIEVMGRCETCQESSQ
jgi:Fur family zinc uptake transcriptional regulator